MNRKMEKSARLWDTRIVKMWGTNRNHYYLLEQQDRGYWHGETFCGRMGRGYIGGTPPQGNKGEITCDRCLRSRRARDLGMAGHA